MPPPGLWQGAGVAISTSQAVMPAPDVRPSVAVAPDRGACSGWRQAHTGPPDPNAAVQVIIHRGRPAAAVNSERVIFAPHINALEPDHPERRFVGAMCLYSHAIRSGALSPPYDQDEAERFARELLMPTVSFLAAAGASDADLAETFTAPVDQVRARRNDTAARC